MEFSPTIFDGLPIGKKDIHGKDIYCGDRVIATESERRKNKSYSCPYNSPDIEGTIQYSELFNAFVFVPLDTTKTTFVRKMVYDINFEKFEVVAFYTEA